MPSKFKYVYQFKIVIEGIYPEIWRVIQVPENYSFWDLHVAIQNVFGWKDIHLHSFETDNPKTGKREFLGIPEEMYDGICDDFSTLPGWDLQISDYFSEKRRSMLYIYDYGDSWRHQIQYEKILFASPKQKYPICLEGRYQGPPEDCGGAFGYPDFVKMITDPLHPYHYSMKRWAGKKKCDIEAFDPKEVRFANPQKQKDATFRKYQMS